MINTLKTDSLGKIILPQPEEISKREKEDAMGAYLMMFAAMGAGLPLPLINLLASVIYYFINKNKSRYVAFHSFQSLVTQIPISILNAILLGWLIRSFIIAGDFVFSTAFFVYLGFVVLWNIVYMVLSIVACVKARKGLLYYMFLFGTISFDRFYGERALKEQKFLSDKQREANVPPSGY